MRRNLFFLLLSFCILSCETEKEGDDLQLFPLSTGNTWTYQCKQAGVIVDTMELYVRNSKMLDVDGQMLECFFVGQRMNSSVDEGHSIVWAYDKNGGILQVGAATKSDTLFATSPYFKYPVKKGDEWQYYELVFSDHSEDLSDWDIENQGAYNMTCIATDSLVVIKSGTFRCLVYEYRFSPFEDEEWKQLLFVKQGEGVVKYDKYVDGEFESGFELLKLSLK